MTDQQLKGFKSLLIMSKAGTEIAMLQHPKGELYDVYRVIHDKIEALLTPSVCYNLTDEDLKKFEDFLEEQTAKLESLVNMPKFPSGGIISPTQTDGGEGVILK